MRSSGYQKPLLRLPFMTLPAFASSTARFLCPEWSVLRFEGPQTREFLQSQLTNDVLSQTPERARLNGLCSPKGRLLASFLVVVRSDEVVDLVVSSDLAPALLKRLSMFVLRTKTKGALASPSVQVAGSLVPAKEGSQHGEQDYGVVQHDEQLWIRFPTTAHPSCDIRIR
jgi:folate-binding Fe-S cluster repair protein YgfZ